jgi:hypothetical protein
MHRHLSITESPVVRAMPVPIVSGWVPVVAVVGGWWGAGRHQVGAAVEGGLVSGWLVVWPAACVGSWGRAVGASGGACRRAGIGVVWGAWPSP